MNLYLTCSGILAMITVVAILRPVSFRFLLDKDTTEPSLGRVGQFVALMVSTWGFIALTVADTLSEWYVTAYMLVWAGAQAASLALKIKGNQEHKP